ncbi:hypothetical protein [Okeania sp. KiyG1]|uniref:hypothetical protein n=1 Tax=Okeania sp. KiyG1 TaxID=2720165 RepID=UPI0019237F78|nr:hypothetical protein [Okeania sp. KiyG1]
MGIELIQFAADSAKILTICIININIFSRKKEEGRSKREEGRGKKAFSYNRFGLITKYRY